MAATATLSLWQISRPRNGAFLQRIIPSLTSLTSFSPLAALPLIPSFRSILELFPPFLLAVPKKKVSHSRKAMRSANKGLKDRTNIVNCPGCGSAKLAHHLCATCYSELSRKWKSQQKEKTV